MSDPDGLIRAYFGQRQGEWPPASPLHAEARQLAAGNMASSARMSCPEVQAMTPTPEMRAAEVGLILDFLTSHLERGVSITELVAPVRALKRYFAIREGELLGLRRVEIASIVGHQMEGILARPDAVVAEGTDEVELQAFFDLGYDDFLAMARPAFERVHAQLRGQRVESQPDPRLAARRLAAFEPVFRLATVRRRRPGALY
jgi:hypothetical protein